MGRVQTKNTQSIKENSINDYVLKEVLKDKQPVQIIYED